jgi:hypothetical protein
MFCVRNNIIVIACAVAMPAAAQTSSDEPQPIIVVAGNDPIITFVRADSEDHKGRVVAQSCAVTREEKNKIYREVRTYAVDGTRPFTWQISQMTINGAPASKKQLEKERKELDKRNKRRDAEDEDRYGIFADLVADKDRIEKLGMEDGMMRYRINRLPDKIAKDIPGAIAKRLRPVLWIADPEGEPYVKRMTIGFGDVRVYVVAKINSARFDLEFERRPDGYVKERRGHYEADFSFFGRKQFKGFFDCDEGGPIALRPAVKSK